MIRSNLCNYGDAYILVSVTVTVTGIGADDYAKQLHEINKEVYLKIVRHLLSA